MLASVKAVSCPSQAAGLVNSIKCIAMTKHTSATQDRFILYLSDPGNNSPKVEIYFPVASIPDLMVNHYSDARY